MNPDAALEYWHDLRDLAGANLKVHLTGGEPFGDWPALLAVLQAAQIQGMTAHEVETNASWCTDRQEAQRRCRKLDEVGLGRLVVSCDLYHQEFVPYERVALLAEVAQKILGPERLRIRWRDFFADPVSVNDMSPPQRRQAYVQAWQNHRDRLTGRAADQIAPLLALQAPETFAGQNCGKAILASRHVHIDPLGNVFPGVCAGIVLGNAANERLARIRRRLASSPDEILQRLITFGPCGLLDLAQQHGYRPSGRGFAGKCHLCSDLRKYLFKEGKFAPTIGPAQCYREY